MSGYLWPCEVCHEIGFKMFLKTKNEEVQIDGSAGSVINYSGPGPRIYKCGKCNGIGYWGPGD